LNSVAQLVVPNIHAETGDIAAGPRQDLHNVGLDALPKAGQGSRERDAKRQ
jgi:hypothetical protein